MPAVVRCVLAGDSKTPRPAAYRHLILEPDGSRHSFTAWLLYVGGAAVHVWARDEAAALHEAGIEAAVPIVVPPQTWPWTMPEDEVMVDLVREAEAWGVPRGSPLVLDVEEWQAERMGSQLPNVLGLFRGAAGAAHFVPVAYGGDAVLAAAGNIARLLARWAYASGSPPPPAPVLPAGLFGWQYAGNVPLPGGETDLDLLAVPAVLMATDFSNPTGLVTISEEGQVSPVLIPKRPAAKAPEPEPATAAPDLDAIAATLPPEAGARIAPTATTAGPTPEAAPAQPATVEPDEPKASHLGAVQLTDIVGGQFVDIATVGDGYLALTAGGEIVAVRVPHLGEPGVGGCAAIAATPSGKGYFVLTDDGLVYHYGDAGEAKAADIVTSATDA
jgi:hypothetical protein